MKARALALLLLLGGQIARAADPVITDEIQLRLPANACSVATAAMALARAAHVPAGVEMVPGACNRPRTPPAPPSGEISFRGQTLTQALDALIQLSPVYEWRNDAGVFVMRPVDAWRDADRFLNRRIGTFEAHDVTLNIALARLQTSLGPWQFGPGPLPESAQMARGVTVSLENARVYEVLDAIAKSHGELRWTVRYCEAQARYEFATIELSSDDGKGIGAQAIFLRDSQGRTYDPCSPRQPR